MNLTNAFSCAGLFLLASALVSYSESSQDKVASRQPGDQTPATAPTTTQATRTPEEMGRHWMQSDQLRDLMKGISANTERNWPNGVRPDPQDPQARDLGRQIDAAGKLADGLAAAAVHIPESVADRPMSEADRAGFRAEADILRDQAMRLGQAAHERKTEQMEKLLTAISATCLSCHSRYRDFSGELDVRRAAVDEPLFPRRAQLE